MTVIEMQLCAGPVAVYRTGRVPFRLLPVARCHLPSFKVFWYAR